MTDARFEVMIGPEHARSFAELTGDWNPLHTDPAYAAATQFGRPILHGAFCAGLMSRMAGMHIPGTECLLHGMRLKFLVPIVPPARLAVSGTLAWERGESGRVEVTISDAESGRRYVDGWYEYGRHRAAAPATPARAQTLHAADEPVVLVTGASGGVGQALLRRLGPRAVGLSRRDCEGCLVAPDLERAGDVIGDAPLAGIVHCAWPAPDNTQLTKLDEAAVAVDYNVVQPLRQVIALGRLLLARGTPDGLLLLVGSTSSDPGRHNYRMPLYTLAKSLVPTLCRILAVELGPSGRRCAAVVFDVVDTGMNRGMSSRTRLAHEDRVPAGRLPTAEEAADQLTWMIANRSSLLSGATITLSGGALP